MSTNSSSGQEGEWISQAEAARVHGVSRQAISKMVRAGRLRSFEIGGHVLVSRVEVSALDRKAATPHRERPDEAGRFLSTFDRLPEEVRREVVYRLRTREPLHPLEASLGTSAEVILDALERSGPMMLRGLRGVLAEAAFGVHVVGPLLEKAWSSLPTVKDPPYDFLLDDGRGPIKVQVKLQRSKAGRPMLASEASRRYSNRMHVVETQRTRGGKVKGEETRPYRFGEFDILVVAIQPSTHDWSHFRCSVANWLVARSEDEQHLAKFQPIAINPNEDWSGSFTEAVEWFRSGIKKTIRFEPE